MREIGLQLSGRAAYFPETGLTHVQGGASAMLLLCFLHDLKKQRRRLYRLSDQDDPQGCHMIVYAYVLECVLS